MSAEESKTLRLDEKVQAEDLLYASYFHTGDKKIFLRSIAIAVAVHVLVLIIHFPQFSRAMTPKKRKEVVIVRKYVPPPPKVERKQIVKKKITKKMPIPDPTPEEPEPIREPEPEIQPDPLPPDVDFLIGIPEEPPPTGPLVVGGDVTAPILLEETKIRPEYPELARVARVEGNVILQAIIHEDGAVGELEILRCNRPNMGFEDAAIQAVKQWRYEPATQRGRAVEVYFTVVVDFALH